MIKALFATPGDLTSTSQHPHGKRGPTLASYPLSSLVWRSTNMSIYTGNTNREFYTSMKAVGLKPTKLLVEF